MEVVNIVITYDSKLAVAIVNQKDEHFQVQGYSLSNFSNVFKIDFRGNYIKMNLVEQNDAGNLFGIAFQDDGRFKVAFLNAAGEMLDTLDINEELALDDKSKPITGFWEPLITCAFLPNNSVFIQCYHRKNKKHYHFNYSFEEKRKLTEVFERTIEDPTCTTRNFPIKSFYSSVTKNCYTFYRQGHCFTINAENPGETKFEKITDADLGTMYLLFDEALVVRSSSSILFFKIDPETMLWKQYHKLENKRGQIYFIKGNVRIQVTTDEMIYFYLIDKETFEPTEENRMFNFMSCSQLMFGAKVRYGISYKTNQPGFTVFTRKYYHNFKVATTQQNFEGAKGANLSSMGAYIMAEQNKIGIYDE